ncbi:MAG TPA: GNAT family N-acetyltransferase [Devosia sp.]
MKKEIYEEPLFPVRRSSASRIAQARALEAATHAISARRQRDMLPGKISTPRLVLRAPMRGDVPDLVRLADNRKIFEVLARLPHPYTRADAIAFVEIMALRPDERPYAITMNGEFLGIIGFSYAEGEPPELGYWLGEPHWGKGIMSEAVKGLTEAAFATRAYPRLKSRALATNTASLNVLEKAGFRRVREGLDTVGNAAGKPTIYLELEQPKWM